MANGSDSPWCPCLNLTGMAGTASVVNPGGRGQNNLTVGTDLQSQEWKCNARADRDATECKYPESVICCYEDGGRFSIGEDTRWRQIYAQGRARQMEISLLAGSSLISKTGSCNIQMCIFWKLQPCRSVPDDTKKSMPGRSIMKAEFNSLLSNANVGDLPGPLLSPDTGSIRT